MKRKARAVRLYEGHTRAELTAMLDAIKPDAPAKNGIGLFLPKTEKLRDDIAWAISYHMSDDRRAAGDPVSVDGWSGRNSNRR